MTHSFREPGDRADHRIDIAPRRSVASGNQQGVRTFVGCAAVKGWLRGYVDIAWAYDVETHAGIQMRNTDIEAIRDALGALDYRVSELVAAPLGQKYSGSFQPGPTKIKELGITDIHFEVEYLGVNLKLTLTVEKSSLFKFDKSENLVVELTQLRSMPRAELTGHIQATIDRLMGRG